MYPTGGIIYPIVMKKFRDLKPVSLQSCKYRRENMNSESVHEIVLEDYPDYLIQHDQMAIGLNNYHEDEVPKIEVIEAPVVKKMIFQFKKPVKLEFS
jgi:hypothetical protein